MDFIKKGVYDKIVESYELVVWDKSYYFKCPKIKAVPVDMFIGKTLDWAAGYLEGLCYANNDINDMSEKINAYSFTQYSVVTSDLNGKFLMETRLCDLRGCLPRYVNASKNCCRIMDVYGIACLTDSSVYKNEAVHLLRIDRGVVQWNANVLYE